MFYSHTFLSRKAPLGTVWCAAHLQHRLKKSHYAATDIPSTVDHIMFPEVPIALRMSGHLLLGIVRIYSKKVEYLYHDCNIILIGLSKVFTSTQVNLPEDARQAPVQAITLPVTLDLDAMELDIDVYDEGDADNHLRSAEDITLADQIPVEREAYVAVTFDDDIMMDDTLPHETFHKSGSIEMNDDLHEPMETGQEGSKEPASDNQAQVPGDQDPGPSNQMEVGGEAEDFERQGTSNQTQVLESVSNESPQEIERRRDPSKEFSTQNLDSVSPDDRNNPADAIGSLEQVLEEKEIRTPSSNLMASEPSMPFQQHSDPPASASNGPQGPFEDGSAQFVILPSPPPQQPRQRRKQGRKNFDEKVVLPNRVMKRALEDCSDIVRKRKKIPCSALGLWKLNNHRKMDRVFNEPSLTGLSEDICNMFQWDCISIKPQFTVPQEPVPEPTIPQSTAPTAEAVSELGVGASMPDPRAGLSPDSAPETDIEFARALHDKSNATDNVLPDFESFPAGSPITMQGSPSSVRSLDSELAPTAATAFTPSIEASTATRGSENPTYRTFWEEQSSLGNTGFSTIPEYGTTETDLYFLEEDSNTPTESIASQGVSSLSARTRAVAKYLKGHSPITPISEDAHVDLSLNKILEGKTRKICARMFYETLVLKSYGMVDVEQETAYGDIILKLNPSLLEKVDASNKM